MRIISKLAKIMSLGKVMSDKPSYVKKKKTDSGGFVWLYGPRAIKKRWDEKRTKIERLQKGLTKLRKKYNDDLKKKDDLRTNAVAAIVGIIDETAMRIGNEESAKDVETYGATTLKVKHITISGSKIKFDFPGKGGVHQHPELSSQEIAKVVKELMKGKKDNDFVFEIEGKKIWDRAVNRYLGPFNISAKDLRGFHSNRLMKEKLKTMDWKEALDEVAELVGHKASTLKNQYLDPDLVAKYEKPKKASISIRALTNISPATVNQSTIINPTTSVPNVSVNLNVGNISPKAITSPRLRVAWRIIAPFCPQGATLISALRTPNKQQNIIMDYWNSSIWSRDGKWYSNKDNGFFATQFRKLLSGSSPPEDIEGARLIMTEKNPQNRKWRPGLKGAPRNSLAIDSISESKHISNEALDIGNVSLDQIEKAVYYIKNDKLLQNYITIDNIVKEPDQENIHVEILKAQPIPDPKILESLLRNYLYGYPMMSIKAELLPEDLKTVEQMRSNYQSAPAISQRDFGDADKVLGAKRISIPMSGLNQEIASTWLALLPYLPPSAKLTSGVRTLEDQERIIGNYWHSSGLSRIYPQVQNPDQQARLLTQNGWIVATTTSSPHLHGHSFDISGADLNEIVDAIETASAEGKVPKLKALVEGKNNAVHVDIHPEQVVAVEEVFISKTAKEIALEEEEIDPSLIYEDLVSSDAPKEILEAFRPAEQDAKDEDKSYEATKNDPKWDEILIENKEHKLTRKQIRDIYLKNADNILKEIKGQKVMIYIGTGKNENVLKRNHNDKPIVMNNKEDLEYWMDRRMTGLHRVFGEKTDLGFVDLDLHNYPFSKAVSYSRKLIPILKKELNTNPEIWKSGGTGLHIEFILDKEWDIDNLRNKLKDLLDEFNKGYDDVSTGIIKDSGMRSDISTLHKLGNLRVKYSIGEKTGNIKEPLKNDKQGIIGLLGWQKNMKNNISKRAENIIVEESDPKTWFEKSPEFIRRQKKTDYKLTEISEGEARSLLSNEPEQFFYKGLYKVYPQLEAEALKNMLKDRAKFYFVFKYDQREEQSFKDLLQPAAEALSQQDPRAFFYYNLQDKYPELGWGTIIKLIDTNPDGFHELGLDKIYPEFIESVGNARNIKDPNKIELELDQLDDITNKKASISKRAAAATEPTSEVEYDPEFEKKLYFMADENHSPVNNEYFKESIEKEKIRKTQEAKHLAVSNPRAFFERQYDRLEEYPELELMAIKNLAIKEPSTYFLSHYYENPKFKEFNELAISNLINHRPHLYFTMHLFADPQFKDFIVRAMSSLAHKEPKFFIETIMPLEKFKQFHYLKQVAENALKKRSDIKQHFISKLAKKDSAGIFIVLPEKLAKQFPSLGKHDDSKPHITALYVGKVAKTKKKLLVETIKELLIGQEPFKIELDDKVTYFPATKHSDGCKVAKMKIISKDLHTFHNKLKKALIAAKIKIDDHFPDYKPHVTLQYMKPPKEKWDDEVPYGSCIVKEIEIWGCGKKKVIQFGKKPISKRAASYNGETTKALKSIPFKETKVVELWHGVHNIDALNYYGGRYFLKPLPKETINGKLWFVPSWSDANKEFALKHAKYALIKVGVTFEFEKSKITKENGETYNVIETYRPLAKSWERTDKLPGAFLYSGEMILPPNEVEIMGKELTAEKLISKRASDKIIAYHGGSLLSNNEFSLKHLGSGEGMAALGKGIYFATNKNIAKLYCKNSSNPVLYTVEIETDSLYNPVKGIPKEIADKIWDVAGNGASSKELDKARDIVEKEMGIKGHYIDLPAGGLEIAVFDPSIIKIIDKEGIKKEASVSKRAKDPLSKYKEKRDFEKTPEPTGEIEKGKNQYRFTIQHHKATSNHWDLRLENDKGTLSSWAIGKHTNPKNDEKLLAIKTEDHVIKYMNFEGNIPEGEYGAGKVEIVNNGKYKPIEWAKDKIKFEIPSGRAAGRYVLIHTNGKNWLWMRL